jgi:hypothetical protein
MVYLTHKNILLAKGYLYYIHHNPIESVEDIKYEIYKSIIFQAKNKRNLSYIINVNFKNILFKKFNN